MADKSKEAIDILSEYRNDIDNDIITDEKDYHTSITYITAGALGFILTVNEKFFQLTEAKWKFWLFTGIALLLVTLILHILNITLTIRTNEKLRDEADKMLEEGKYNVPYIDALWLKETKKSRLLNNIRFILLIAGVVCEIIFILNNIYAGKQIIKEDKTDRIKIEIIKLKDSSNVFMDSTHKNVKILLENH